MAPILALSLCAVAAILLIYYDRKITCDTSIWFWIPLFWFLIAGSRMVSIWFNYRNVDLGSDIYLEGNPFDRNIFLVLMILGLMCLWKRKISVFNTIRSNKYLFLFMSYCLLSVVWSDYPVVATKRFFKSFGNIIMVLVVLSENKPFEAYRALFRRASYVLLPFSVALYKFYPNLGRIYHRYSGELSITGVTTNKNALGAITMVLAVYYFYEFINRNTIYKNKINIRVHAINVAMFALSLFLLYKSKSATSYICFISGVILCSVGRTNIFEKIVGHWRQCVAVGLMMFLGLEIFFDPITQILAWLGRDVTLTSRTEIWQEVLRMQSSPTLGCGYDSFWLGNRIDYFWDKYWWHPTESHNGYIEVYSELGVIGVILFVLLIYKYLSINMKLIKGKTNAHFIQIIYIVIFILYNVTETAYKGLHVIWFVFLLSMFNMVSICSDNNAINYQKMR